ncbi:hypothetical protein D3C76_1486090 [compost metagenome]
MNDICMKDTLIQDMAQIVRYTPLDLGFRQLCRSEVGNIHCSSERIAGRINPLRHTQKQNGWATELPELFGLNQPFGFPKSI